MQLELSDNEFRYVIQVLAAQPFGQVAGLIDKLSKQAEAQKKQPEDAAS